MEIPDKAQITCKLPGVALRLTTGAHKVCYAFHITGPAHPLLHTWMKKAKGGHIQVPISSDKEPLAQLASPLGLQVPMPDDIYNGKLGGGREICSSPKNRLAGTADHQQLQRNMGCLMSLWHHVTDRCVTLPNGQTWPVGVAYQLDPIPLPAFFWIRLSGLSSSAFTFLTGRNSFTWSSYS